MQRTGAWLLLLALVAAAAVPLALGGGEGFIAALRLPARAHVAIIALVFASFALRTVKQNLLMRRLQLRAAAWHVLAMSQATELAFLATPGGIGGYAAGIFYLRRSGASYAAATAICAADQFLDLAFFVLAMPVALLFLVDAPEIGWLRGIVRAGAALGAIVLAGAWLLRKPVARWLFGRNGPIERLPWLRRRSAALRDFLANLRAQVGMLFKAPPGWSALLFLATTGQWITRYGVLWLVLRLLEHPAPFGLLFLLQGIVLHAAQWTGAPAGAGGADIGLAAALAPFAPAGVIAAALLLWRFATLHLALIAGVVSAVALRDAQVEDAPARTADEPVA